MRNSLSDAAMMDLVVGKSYLLTLTTSGQVRRCTYIGAILNSGDIELCFEFEDDPFTVGINRPDTSFFADEEQISFGQDAPIKVVPVIEKDQKRLST